MSEEAATLDNEIVEVRKRVLANEARFRRSGNADVKKLVAADRASLRTLNAKRALALREKVKEMQHDT